MIVFVLAAFVALAAPGPTDHVDPASTSSRRGPTRTTAPFAAGRAGDTIAQALPVGALPFTAQGNTCGYADDYDEACPFGESTSPDVVYAFIASGDGGIDVGLCGSDYDTKVYVYRDGSTPGSPLACDDDGCGVDGFRSELLDVPVEAGHTYYLVVDGYFGACGDFVLEVVTSVPCVPRCAPGDEIEPEVACTHGYVDVTNGGCVSPNPVFTDIPCGSGASAWCGTYGGYIGEGTTEWRDTDWYTIDPAANGGGVVWCVTGEYRTQMGLVDPAAGCEAPVFAVMQIVEPCATGCITLPPGNWWLFVATAGFGPNAGACGGRYRMTLDGYECPLSVRATTWATLKARHR